MFDLTSVGVAIAGLALIIGASAWNEGAGGLLAIVLIPTWIATVCMRLKKLYLRRVGRESAADAQETRPEIFLRALKLWVVWLGRLIMAYIVVVVLMIVIIVFAFLALLTPLMQMR